MDKIKRLACGKKKSKTPESGDSSATSNRVDPVGKYLNQSSRRLRGLIENSGLELKDGNVYKADDEHTIARRLSYQTPTPVETSQRPRMPPIHRIPTPLTTSGSGRATSSTSSEVPSGPPSTLFMPPQVPSIPGVDERGVCRPYSMVNPVEAYMFQAWPENMIWRTCRISKTKLYAELAELENEEGRAEAEPKKKKKTRGPSKGLALDAYVSKNGRHKIPCDEKYGRPILASDACTAYCRNVGFVICDRVPVLWAEWKDVPSCVKDALNNAMSVWFEVPSFLLHTWCHEVQTVKYKSWKNELHMFWSAWGDSREATPEEFKYREYEWRWLCAHFSDPDYIASSSTNATNRKGLTEHHSLGSRSLARVSHEATSDPDVSNAFVYVTKKAYPNYPDRLEKVTEESERMLTQIAMEEHPDLDETGLELARREIDQADPYIRARVWGNVFPPKGSHYRTPMMGAEGNQLLKRIPGFQRHQKSDTQQAYLEEQLRIERELRAEEQRKSQDQFQKFQEEQRKAQEEQRKAQQEMLSQQQAMMQYMMSLSQIVSQSGISVPPPPPQFFNSQTPPSSSQPRDDDMQGGSNPSSIFKDLMDL